LDHGFALKHWRAIGDDGLTGGAWENRGGRRNGGGRRALQETCGDETEQAEPRETHEEDGRAWQAALRIPSRWRNGTDWPSRPRA